MTNNILATIPGEHIARAALSLPDAESAPDAPHQVVTKLPRPDSRRVRITFRRFKHKRAKTTRWFWTAESAEVME
jgi:hypothetical protein